MSDIDLVLVTWPNHPQRMVYLRHCVETLRSRLSATGFRLRWLCSSETDRDPASTWHGEELEAFCRQESIRLTWHEGPASLGAGMNAAVASTAAPLVFLVQDDFELREPLDLAPGATLLLSRPEVDLVRYSYPQHLGCKFVEGGEIDGFRRFDLHGPWPYGDEPHLRRRDFTKKFGTYKEDIGHQAEGDMLWRLVRMGAVIVAADHPYFGHVGAISAVPLAKDRRQHQVSR